MTEITFIVDSNKTQARLLEGITSATQLLLNAQQPEEAMPKVVQILGQCTGVDRCYIFTNVYKESGHAYMRQLYEWAKSGISEQIDNPDLQLVSYDILPGLYGELSQGNSVSGLVRESPDEHRAIMEAQEILSYLFLPIFSGNKLWGFIGYDDCTTERIWTDAEIATLQTVAGGIGIVFRRHELEQALREKNSKYELALRGSQHGIWELDLVTGKTFVSRQWRDLFGFHNLGDDSLDYELYLTLVHPDDREKLTNEIEEYLKKGYGNLDTTYRVQHSSGEFRWVASRSAAEWDIHGKPVRLGGSDWDITERRQFEERLANNERQYRELVDNLNEVIFETDEEGRFTFLNKAWTDLTGYPIEESLGRRGSEYVYIEDEAVVPQVTQQISKRNTASVTQEFRYLRKDGKPIWVSMHGAKRFDGAGMFVGYRGTITDIQLRKEAQLQLIENEFKYRLISENITDLVTQHTQDGEISFASNSIQELIGYTPAEVIGKNPFAFVHPEDRERVLEEVIDKLQERDKAVKVQYRLLHKEGQGIWVESVVRYVVIREKLAYGLQASTRNITERMLAEQEMKKALEKEKELRDLKSRFIVMASHEFRTPLATIQSSLDLLEYYSKRPIEELGSKQDKHFKRIRNEIGKVTTLMNDILLLGKLEAGSSKMKIESTDLIEFVNELIEASFSNESDGRIPEFSFSGLPKEVNIDRQLMHHAISNLLSNALKFSAGKPNPQVHLNYLIDKVLISITDFGIGIPKNEKNRIFESFYRGSNTSEFQGTGLGLVISQEFVTLHRGKIWYTSVPHQKTVFYIELNL